MLAQQPGPATPSDSSTPSTLPYTKNSGHQSAQWKGLTVKEKLKYDWIHLFDVENVAFAGIGASFDELRDHPSQWGEGGARLPKDTDRTWDSTPSSAASCSPSRRSTKKSTRYFPSARTSIRGRIGDALLHTIWRHDDTGGMMPAYSEFLGDYGAAAVSRLWWPQQYHRGSAIFIAGSDTVLVDAGINVFNNSSPI